MINKFTCLSFCFLLACSSSVLFARSAFEERSISISESSVEEKNVVENTKIATATKNKKEKKDDTEKITEIFLPGHDEGNKDLVCQGIAYLPDEKLENGDYRYVLLSYYPNTKVSKACAQIVVIDRAKKEKNKAIKRFSLYNYKKVKQEDGTTKKEIIPYTLHAGGIAVAGNYMWVSSNFKLWGFKLKEIKEFIEDTKTEAKAEKGLPQSLNELPAKDLVVAKKYGVDSKASFVSFDGTYLWLGDYAIKTTDKNNSYLPIEHHKIFKHYAWLAAYKVDDKGCPLSDETYSFKYKDNTYEAHKPDVVLGLRRNAQGVAVCGDYIAISISCGREKAKLAFYENPLTSSKKENYITYSPEGESKSFSVEAYDLSSENHVKTVSKPIAAGIEDLEFDGKYVYVTFECKAGKYIEAQKGRKIKSTDNFYLINLEKLKLDKAKKKNKKNKKNEKNDKK